MRLTCIVDNAVQLNAPLWGEHGLSYLIETPDGRVLFDTGQSGTVLLHNLQCIDVDPATIDALAISHAHYDHTGGLSALLPHLRPGIPLYASPDLFRERWAQRGEQRRSIGLPLSREGLAAHFTLKLDAAPQRIIAGVWTTGMIAERPAPLGNGTNLLMREDGGNLVPDEYRDDMALVLEDDARLVLLCGCCHAGLLNTLAHVERAFAEPIVAILGGLHLNGSGNDVVRQCASKIAAMPALETVYPGHCTGQSATLLLHEALGSARMSAGSAGTAIEIGQRSVL
jgi:7,8-dihydropterin-6-yl-methyl-4-(beta-D-ribofuranosyl)aminobenzene 5'-phosphate synthase